MRCLPRLGILGQLRAIPGSAPVRTATSLIPSPIKMVLSLVSGVVAGILATVRCRTHTGYRVAWQFTR